MEEENQTGLIKQWSKRATALDCNWRESKREEEILKGKKKTNGALALRPNQQETPGQSLLQPQVWLRRQELYQQWVPTGPAPMEDVERTNIMIARPQQQEVGFPLRNSYIMDVDRRENRNCYTCRGFGHLARNCRNRGMRMNRRMEVD